MRIIRHYAGIFAVFLVASGSFAFSGGTLWAADMDLAALMAERDALKNQLSGLRSENTRCEKQKTGWTVATIVGGIGVVGTTAGAIYQGVDLRNKNNELAGVKKDVKAAEDEIKAFSGGQSGGTQQ